MAIYGAPQGGESSSSDSRVRQALILSKLDRDGSVKVLALSEELRTSTVTIRKDLDAMEREGLLERTHGGAIKRKATPECANNFSERLNARRDEKRRIAAAAANLVNDGDSVLLNTGSTTYYVAQCLREKQDLLVFTNSYNIFGQVCFCHNIVSVMIGGRFDCKTGMTYGEDAIEQLSKYKINKLIMGMDGIDVVHGATTYDHISQGVTRRMLENSKERILVVDDTKIGKTALVHICDLNKFQVIITNQCPDHTPVMEELVRMGIRVIYA